MKKVFDWLKANWQFVTIIAAIGGAAIGVKFTLKKDPNATQPEVIIVIPENDQPFVMGAADTPRLGLLRLRVRAASALAKEQGWDGAAGWVKAFRCCQKVTDEQIVGSAIQAGFNPPVGAPGDLIRQLIEWITDPANQEKIMRLIEFIIKLAVSFA